MLRILLMILLFFGVLDAGAVVPENCSSSATQNITVYYGWPLALDCGNFFQSSNFDYIVYVDGDYDKVTEFQCVIYDRFSGSQVLNASANVSFETFYDMDVEDFIHKIDEVNNSTSMSYEMVVTYKIRNTSSIDCIFQIINLNPAHQQRCNESQTESTVETTGVEVGESLNLFCSPPDGLKKFADEAVLEVRWLYNCNESRLPNNALDGKNNQLKLTNASHETTPGVYTCVTKYRGQSRYTVHDRICVKDPVTTELTLKCSDNKAAVGQDVEIECDIDAGLGHEKYYAFYSKVQKLDQTGSFDAAESNSSCSAHADENDTIAVNERFSCNLTLLRIGGIQQYCVPTIAKEREKQRTKLKFYYKIRKAQVSDFGEYSLTVKRTQLAYNTTFRLEENRGPALKKWVVILIFCLAAVVSLILFLTLLYRKRVRLRLMWKRKFGATEKAIKPYAAYLAYYYHEDMPQQAITALDSFIKSLECRLKRLGANFYDKCRENHSENTAANIYAKLTECHRVIIILTPEYIRDQWSVFETYQAWKNVIEFGIPIIFITFPATKSAIEELDTEPRIALKKALKRHNVIKWGGKLPFSGRFKMTLELLMPKLPRDDNIDMGNIQTLIEDQSQ